MDSYDYGSFIDYGNGAIAHHPLAKKSSYNSEEIIAVNDSDNDVIVPHDMQVQQLEESDQEQDSVHSKLHLY